MQIGEVFKCQTQDEMAIVRFAVPGDKVNTWTKAAIDDLARVISVLEEKNSLQGVIFISDKATGFHSGADLNFLARQEKELKQIMQVIDNIQHLFLRLENLGLPTLAAIDGPCLGGGYEFALAMTARLATDSARTVIGLPECTIGIFPGGGGTQRLPRLIGDQAIDLIVLGQVVSAARALELGMVDRLVVGKDNLLERAKEFLQEILTGKTPLKRPHHDFSRLDDLIEKAKEKSLQANRGRLLPAPRLALKAIEEGLTLPLQEGLEVEEKYFGQVIATPEAWGGINAFFLKVYSGNSAKMLPPGFSPKPLKKLAVLGLGMMGRGIAIEIVRKMQVPVVVKDFPEAIEAGEKFIRTVFEDMAKRSQLDAPVDYLLGLIKPVSEWTEDFRDVDLVIEAVFEDPAAKAGAYKELSTLVPDDCLIASNTSSIPITRLAENIINPERFGGAHFFSPVWRMELLEIIRGAKTSTETINNLLHFSAAIKKRPVVCNDHPGFVVNAMLFPYFLKSIEFLEEGVSIEKIDKAMVDFGFPIGPIKLIDEIGIDTAYSAFTKSLGIKPPTTIENIFRAGRFGRKKAGKGFFLADGSVDPEALPYIFKKDVEKEYSTEEVQELLFLPFVEVGRELLKEKVVADPRAIDIGAIWGVSFPAYKGGPLKWADLTGLSKRLYGLDFYSIQQANEAMSM